MRQIGSCKAALLRHVSLVCWFWRALAQWQHDTFLIFHAMRRKRRRRKSWLARLFSPKARAEGRHDVKPERSPASKAPAPSPIPATPPALVKSPAPAKSPISAKSPAAGTSSERVPRPVPPIPSTSHGPGETPPVRTPIEEWLAAYWRKAGGGSLVLSVLIHLALLIIASFIVTSAVGKRAIDFLSGGGTKSAQAASQELAHQLQTKKKRVLTKPVPMRRVVSTSATSTIALPDIPMTTIALPEMASILGGNMGSGGFGSNGAGGGFGNGVGIGGMSGKSFKPITIFGKNLNARSIAVIMDVSGSMTPHLTAVIEELDRVAKGSPVVLYNGCGVAKPPTGVRLRDDTLETRRSASFRAFWQDNHGPEEEVYSIMKNRPFTYYIKSQGIQYAWISLLTDEVRHAEALYWFSDFQDEVDDEQLESVLTNLKRRRQKLFIHASERGSSFEKVRDQLCTPSGGSVIQPTR